MAKRVSRKRGARKVGRVGARRAQGIGDFLPAAPELVKAIAMQGFSDDELAIMMGLDPKIVEAWRKYYSSFDKALEEGRTLADANVINALYNRAVGCEVQKDVLVKLKEGHGRGAFSETVEVHTITERHPPDTNACKTWLACRDPERWNPAVKVGGGKKGDEPVQFGVKQETKLELMSSILSLIQPKPDGV